MWEPAGLVGGVRFHHPKPKPGGVMLQAGATAGSRFDFTSTMGSSVWEQIASSKPPVAFGSSLENTKAYRHRMRAWTFFPILGVSGLALTNIALR